MDQPLKRAELEYQADINVQTQSINANEKMCKDALPLFLLSGSCNRWQVWQIV